MIPDLRDYKKRVERWVTHRLKKASVLVSILKSFAESAEELEAVFSDIAKTRDFNTAEGAALDLWGDLVDVPRSGRSDSDYRRVIATKYLVNSSEGTPPELIEIVDRLTEPTKVLFIQYTMVAAFEVEGASVAQEFRREVRRMVEDALVGGEQLGWIIESDANTFGFDSGPGFDDGEFGIPY